MRRKLCAENFGELRVYFPEQGSKSPLLLSLSLREILRFPCQKHEPRPEEPTTLQVVSHTFQKGFQLPHNVNNHTHRAIKDRNRGGTSGEAEKCVFQELSEKSSLVLPRSDWSVKSLGNEGKEESTLGYTVPFLIECTCAHHPHNICTHIHTHTCTHICIHTYTHGQIHICTLIYKHIYTTYTYAHVHTHTHKRMLD